MGEVPIPDRVILGESGAYWRQFDTDGITSMCVVSTDNDPVVPLAVFVPERPYWSDPVLVEKVAQGLHEASHGNPQWKYELNDRRHLWLAEARRVLGEPS